MTTFFCNSMIDTIQESLMKIDILSIKIDSDSIQVPIVIDGNQAEMLIHYDNIYSLLSVDCYMNIKVEPSYFIESLKYINMVNSVNNKGTLFIDKDNEVGLRRTMTYNDPDIDVEDLKISIENAYVACWNFARYVIAIQQGTTATEAYEAMEVDVTKDNDSSL